MPPQLLFVEPVTVAEFTRLADDGCPNCPEHTTPIRETSYWVRDGVWPTKPFPSEY